MAYELKLPDLGEGLTEGEIARWLVSEGDEVAEDQPLVEIQTDKTTVEIPSPAAGTVARVLASEGEVVPVGTVIVVIAEDGVVADEQPRAEPAPQQEVAAEPATSGGQSPGRGREGRVQAAPIVRRLAHELGVPLETVEGTGPGGRITEEDMRRAASSATPEPATANVSRGQTPGPVLEGRRVPLRGVRRVIAEHLARAHREVPAVTVVEECDFTELGRIRGERSYLPYVLEASVEGLKEYPELNATLDGDEVVYWERYDLGVAVQTHHGLVVPVLRNADQRSLDELAAEAARLAEGARAGTLEARELRGSTFTLTSAGRVAGLFATPLVNHPEVAILGLHRIAPRPVVRDAQVVAREIGWLSCTFDHRVVDGARASAFLLDVIARLEQPE